MNDPEKEFSNVRVFGTIGWVVAGLLISYLFGWDSKTNAASGLLKNTFLMTSIVSLMLGLFSFSLPKTPPTKSAGGKISLKEIIGLDAMKLLKDRNFFIFFISSILICIPLAFYYQVAPDFISNIGVKNPTGKMAIGQISEILFMLLLPVFFSKFGFKRTILVGMAAWAIRYVLFAFGNAGDLSFMLLIGIALHGVCYDFFFVSGYIYTNSKAGEKYKSAAQGLITLATYGVGMLIGFAIAGMITDSYKISDKVFDYKMVWLIPSAIALGVFLIFTVFFKDEKNKVLKPGQIN
jgi:nucleoside transporter